MYVYHFPLLCVHLKMTVTMEIVAYYSEREGVCWDGSFVFILILEDLSESSLLANKLFVKVHLQANQSAREVIASCWPKTTTTKNPQNSIN